MASFLENLQLKQQQWEKVQRVFQEYQTAFNDLEDMISATPTMLQNEIRRSDEFSNRKAEFDKLSEEFETLRSTTTNVNFEDNSDWESIQEFMDNLDKARTKFVEARDEFLG